MDINTLTFKGFALISYDINSIHCKEYDTLTPQNKYIDALQSKKLYTFEAILQKRKVFYTFSQLKFLLIINNITSIVFG